MSSNLPEKKCALNVCLMWHSVYQANMGVSALTYATLRYLEEVAKELNLHFDYTILGHRAKDKSGCADEITINGDRIPFTFEGVTIPGGVNARRPSDWWVLLRWLVFRSRAYIGSLSGYDLFFDISEGDSFTDIYGSARFIEMSLSKLLALATGKTLVLLPQTIGPFDFSPARNLANQVMRRIQYIYPRDQDSLDYLEKAFPHREFQEYLDVAFHLPYEKTRFAPDKIHVGLNISALLWQGGYTHDNMFKLTANYRKLINDIIQYFLEQGNVLIHLIPHVISHDHLSREDDYALAERIHKDIPDTILAPAFKTPIEAKSYISGLDFLIGSRMHACIAAYSSQVPVMPMAYSRKFSGLFLYSLGYPVLIDLRHDNGEQACQKVMDGFENRTALRAEILAKRSVIEKDIAAFRHELANIVGEVYESQVT